MNKEDRDRMISGTFEAVIRMEEHAHKPDGTCQGMKSHEEHAHKAMDARTKWLIGILLGILTLGGVGAAIAGTFF